MTSVFTSPRPSVCLCGLFLSLERSAVPAVDQLSLQCSLPTAAATSVGPDTEPCQCWFPFLSPEFEFTSCTLKQLSCVFLKHFIYSVISLWQTFDGGCVLCLLPPVSSVSSFPFPSVFIQCKNKQNVCPLSPPPFFEI